MWVIVKLYWSITSSVFVWVYEHEWLYLCVGTHAHVWTDVCVTMCGPHLPL